MELSILVLVALFTLLVRLLWLEQIETGSDAYQRWHFARQWFHSIDLQEVIWNHQKTRLGVVVPIFLAQALLGRGILVYYVVAIGCAVGLSLASYGVARILGGRIVGILTVLLLVFAPNAERMGSQINPESFAALYALVALLALFRYQGDPARRFRWAAVSSVFLFLSYLAKETGVFFVPAAVFCTWLAGRRLPHALGYAGIQLGLLGVESLGYWLATPFSSRFAVVRQSHGQGEPDPMSFWKLFERYTSIDRDYRWLLGGAFVAAIVLLLAKRRDPRFVSVVAFPLSAYFLITFLVQDLDPLTLWMRFLSRYLDLGLPFAVVVIVVAAGEVVRDAARGVAGVAARWPRIGERARVLRGRVPPALVAWSAPLAALLSFGTVSAWALWLHFPLSNHYPLTRARHYADTMTEAYRRGIPIVASGKRGHKALGAAFTLYINDDLLVENGSLPDFDRVFENPPEVLQRIARPDLPSHCRVKLTVHGMHIGMKPKEGLRESCFAPAEEDEVVGAL